MEHDVVIVGAGISGLCMGMRLAQEGVRDFVILERAAELGGTWRDNRYPGCACDVKSSLYSFSFEPNPDWDRKFASWEQILGYLRACATKHGLHAHLRYGAEVQRCTWEDGGWTVGTADGRSFRGRTLVFGIGALSNPLIPDMPGLERFRGPRFHSAQWDKDVPLEGKRVAVIGSGASAVQFVPEIAGKVAKLDYYQRTPPWVLPKPDRARPDWEKALVRAVPALGLLERWAVYWTAEARVLAFTTRPWLMGALAWLGRRHIAWNIRDEAKRAAVTPAYTPGCKRILMSNDYYPALNRENVEIHTDAIVEVQPDGIRTKDGSFRPADVLIFGTGFRVHEMVRPGMVTGREGQDLATLWSARGGPEAYLGITVAGFPNLFMLMGPNTGLGHSSMIFMIEAQVEHAMRAMRTMRERGLRAVDVRGEVQEGFVGRTQEGLRRSVWASGCRSWYLNAAGKNTTLWPGFTFTYHRLARAFRLSDYEVVE